MENAAAFAMKQAQRPCPICGAVNVEALHRQPFVLPEASPLPPTYDVVACGRCSFVYADTPGNQADYDRYYEEFSKYEDPAVATGGGDSPLDLERIEETAALLATHLSDHARLLDIGCAGGGLLAAMRRRGFTHLLGLDPSPTCIARLTNDGLAGVCGKLSQLAPLEGRKPFDAIVLSHVLEHVVALQESMAALRRMLAPNGLLYIEVPDGSRYADHPFVPYYYFDSEHINHFDITSLANLAAVAGFRVLTCGHRDIPVGEARTYPAVYAFLTPADGTETVDPAAELRANMIAYIELSHRDAAFPLLARLVAEDRPIALWGAGSYAQRLLGQSPLAGSRIIAVVDRDHNKQGRQFAGHTIRAPETGLLGLPANTAVVIANALHAEAVADEYRALCLTYEIVQPDKAENRNDSGN